MPLLPRPPSLPDCAGPISARGEMRSAHVRNPAPAGTDRRSALAPPGRLPYSQPARLTPLGLAPLPLFSEVIRSAPAAHRAASIPHRRTMPHTPHRGSNELPVVPVPARLRCALTPGLPDHPPVPGPAG